MTVDSGQVSKGAVEEMLRPWRWQQWRSRKINIEDSQQEEDATGLVIVVAAGFRFLFFLLKWFSRVNRGAPTDSHYLYLSPILIGLFQYLTPTLSK